MTGTQQTQCKSQPLNEQINAVLQGNKAPNAELQKAVAQFGFN